MSFDSGPLDRYLAAAIGNDRATAVDLRGVLTRSVGDLADLMARSRCDANWNVAALRLKSLAATYGVISLIALAEEAMAGAPGDPAVLRRINAAIDAMA